MEACDLMLPDVSYADWTGLLLVAERQGEVVGFIHAFPGKPYAVITEMGVLPAFRKGRAATKLMESLELLFRSMGLRSWGCYVGDKRDDAKTALIHHGALETGHGSMYWRNLG